MIPEFCAVFPHSIPENMPICSDDQIDHFVRLYICVCTLSSSPFFELFASLFIASIIPFRGWLVSVKVVLIHTRRYS